MDSKYIYILSNVLMESYQNNRVVDLYSIADGKYVKTIKIPELSDKQKAVEISINKKQILTVVYEDMNLVNYQLKI